MKDFYTRPQLEEVVLQDKFWSPYTENFRNITIPYCFEKFEETKYIQNFIDIAQNNKNPHVSFPFSDGLVLETITGASNFLVSNYDKSLDSKLDELIEIIVSAQESDGFLCTMTSSDYPDKRWGENGGDIVDQHDLYNHGTLIEAAVAHYKATKKTSLLIPAIKAANLICSYIGEAPKHHVIPGHSLPESAFMDLYRLFKEDKSLENIKNNYTINPDDYLEIVRYWYDCRGECERRSIAEISSKYDPSRYQNAAPFYEQKTAMGHAVRAGLCYLGAASYYRETKAENYLDSLKSIWNDITTKKIHISGGVGSRADIEGFDAEYSLQNDAYLETCAGIALAFFAAEMSLIEKNSNYFDIFELSLYNNILGSMSEDFKKFYYDNPLVNDGTKNRWEWHNCPCCPPMLSKIYSALRSYIYSMNTQEVCVNMYIGSTVETEDFKISQADKNFKISLQKPMLINFRIPAYTEDFSIKINGKKANFENQNGYAVLSLDMGETEIWVEYNEKLCEICANEKVNADIGRVCIMKGPKLYCAEGKDNNGEVEFTIAESTKVTPKDENIEIALSNGQTALLIPYHKRNNRVSENTSDSKMAVWFKKENTKPVNTKQNLYGYYKIY